MITLCERGHPSLAVELLLRFGYRLEERVLCELFVDDRLELEGGSTAAGAGWPAGGAGSSRAPARAAGPVASPLVPITIGRCHEARRQDLDPPAGRSICCLRAAPHSRIARLRGA